MANYITDINGNRIACKGLQVKPNSDTLKVVTRMLDGQFSVQQVGTAAVTLQVTLQVTDKTDLDEICATCEPIYFYHYTKRYLGIITSQAITWQQTFILGMWYQGTFDIAVSEVINR